MKSRQTLFKNYNSKSSNGNSLSKLYRLYSPQNKFRPHQKYPIKNKHQQPPIVELIFNHPHLLFMQSQNNQNVTQKQAMTELNIVKNIVQRKKQKSMIKKSHKPMTAPNIKRKHYTEFNFSNTEGQQQQQIYNQQTNHISVFNFNDFAQTAINANNNNNINNNNNNLNSNYSSHNPTNRLMPKTSQSKYRRSLRQNNNNNQQLQLVEKSQSHRNSLNKNRNTFDSFISQKKKTINIKYQQDKILRQNKYQSNNHVAQLYVNMEAKFAKFVKRNL